MQTLGLISNSSDKQSVTCASLTFCEICPQLLVQLEGKVANGEIKELHQIMSKPHVKVSIHESSVHQVIKNDQPYQTPFFV